MVASDGNVLVSDLGISIGLNLGFNDGAQLVACIAETLGNI